MLIALKVREANTEEITGAVAASLQNAKVFPRPDYPFADIVGTGGDGQNTINISTASAIVAASMGAKWQNMAIVACRVNQVLAMCLPHLALM